MLILAYLLDFSNEPSYIAKLVVKNWLKHIKLQEVLVSRVIGLTVLILVGGLIFSYVKSVNTVNPEQMSSSKTEQAVYEVRFGDSLWTIAEANYGSGYKWTDIYNANKSAIATPDNIEIGIKLIIPENRPLTISISPGDNLWNIAQVYCEDGFLYSKLASNNKILNPEIIEPGLVIQISCR